MDMSGKQMFSTVQACMVAFSDIVPVINGSVL